MAKGYAVFTEVIRDQDRYQNYVRQVMPTIERAGGRIIVVDGAVRVLEGQWHGARTVVLEFESVAAALGWYESDAYRSIIGERHASADANAVILSGV